MECDTNKTLTWKSNDYDMCNSHLISIVVTRFERYNDDMLLLFLCFGIQILAEQIFRPKPNYLYMNCCPNICSTSNWIPAGSVCKRIKKRTIKKCWGLFRVLKRIIKILRPILSFSDNYSIFNDFFLISLPWRHCT